MPKLSTGTVTFLFSHIGEEHHHFGSAPGAMQGALMRHDALVEQSSMNTMSRSYGHAVRVTAG